jgi:uncharacterized protein (DUF488 family)
MSLYSIGHSNASIESFLALLRRHEVDLLVDTRSKPYSRYNPQFRREPLKRSLSGNGIKYVFMGQALGGRPENAAYYFESGKVNYERLAEARFFQQGIERLIALGQDHCAAFMCAEADYKHCHRYWLITRTLMRREVEVKHILHSGEVLTSESAEFESDQLSLF